MTPQVQPSIHPNEENPAQLLGLLESQIALHRQARERRHTQRRAKLMVGLLLILLGGGLALSILFMFLPSSGRGTAHPPASATAQP